MLDPNNISFEKLGFKAGLEVHHQINSKRKLFCHCKPALRTNPPDYLFERKFRPVLGEMGDFDEGMLIEYEKGYRVIYHAYSDCTCLYEQDEQPPFWPDLDAIYSGFELSHWLNCSALVDVAIVARKQYLDGSITTGFQRTLIVARDGWVEVNGKRVKITNLTVEEDAARKLKTENYGRTVYYNLDRLGIPLVEVITDHKDCSNPKDLKKLAEIIGLTLRLSGIGRTGIGSARQDVNISIKGGDRVEIKGVQDLPMLDTLCRREAVRQDMLIHIAKILKEQGFKPDDLEHTYYEITEELPTESIPEGLSVMAIRVPKFNGILGLEIQPGKDFGQDVFEKASLISGILVDHMFHSDELAETAQRKKKDTIPFLISLIDKKIDNKIRKVLYLKDKDAYCLAMGKNSWTIHAMKKIIERLKYAIKGVPQETRRLLPNGNTEFLRVIHGKDRLYPDTDTPALDLDLQKIQHLKEQVKKRPWELEKEFQEKYGLEFEHLQNLVHENRLLEFIHIVNKNSISPKLVYSYLTETMKHLRRKGVDTSKIYLEEIMEDLKNAYSVEKPSIYDYAVAKYLQEKGDKK
ncbi:MAG: Glu-tRNA(Gln) amidotransferase subunit GatE [Promethearchaeota archaeon]|nr:MAG: Glu-tRNA(Gln) amidotransferase subunit GatE [Candidatus Lokiarchaeota archaeon]